VIPPAPEQREAAAARLETADLALRGRFLTEGGQIMPRRKTMVCAKKQVSHCAASCCSPAKASGACALHHIIGGMRVPCCYRRAIVGCCWVPGGSAARGGVGGG